MVTSGELNIVAVGQSLIKRDISACPRPAFHAVRQLIRAADVAFTNFEGTIQGAHGGWPTKPASFNAADPAVLDVLRGLGFTALSLSNNHAFDLGPNGVLSTLAEVERRGFLHAGIGRDLTQAARPGMRDTAHGRIALVAVDAGPAPAASIAQDATDRVPARPGVNPQRVTPVTVLPAADVARLRAIAADLGHRALRAHYRGQTPPDDPPGELDFYGMIFRAGEAAARIGELDRTDLARNLGAIAEAAAQARFVIAYLHHHHWEAVWEDIPAWVRDYAHACIDAGAHMFVSHGVPLLQGIEIYRGQPLFYSLGNFIFHSFAPGTWAHPDIWRSVVATCAFRADGPLAALRLDPVVLGGEVALETGDFAARDVPLRAEVQAGNGTLQRLAGLSAKLGTRIIIDGGVGRWTAGSG